MDSPSYARGATRNSEAEDRGPGRVCRGRGSGRVRRYRDRHRTSRRRPAPRCVVRGRRGGRRLGRVASSSIPQESSASRRRSHRRRRPTARAERSGPQRCPASDACVVPRHDRATPADSGAPAGEVQSSLPMRSSPALFSERDGRWASPEENRPTRIRLMTCCFSCRFIT